MKSNEDPSNFVRLFQPINIGTLELENRIVFLATGSRLFEEGGRITDVWAEFFITRARGGAGLVTAPASPIRAGKTNSILGLYDDQPLNRLRTITDEIHGCQAKAAVQLTAKNEWEKEVDHPLEYVAPSAVARRNSTAVPRELTIDEIQILVSSFGDAARRAKQAGFDLVEIHAGMGYLVNQFLSPLTNHRTDAYGGSLEARLRFLLEIIADIREKVGASCPLMVRLAADEFMPGGNTLNETSRMAVILEQAGVHALNIQGGWHDSKVPLSHSVVAPGSYAYLAEAIKQVVRIPVVAAYRINSPQVAEEILSADKGDLIGMARSLLADPYFPEKARTGRTDEIVPCIACMRCLENILVNQEPITCTVNPYLGREAESIIIPALDHKKVFVAGGGPAGLTAAWAAAERGHLVTVWEKEAACGGALQIASIPPHKEELAALSRFLINRAKKAGVQFKLGQALTPVIIREEKPDTVIMATGALPLIPSLPGVDGENVANALDVISGQVEVGPTVVVIGGGLVGCETGLFLAAQGKKVVILEKLNRAAAKVSPSNRWVMLQELKSVGVIIQTNINVSLIQPDGVQVSSADSSSFVPADSVVLAIGMNPNQELIAGIPNNTVKITVIGDALRPRSIYEAIREGLQAGLSCD